MSFVGTISPSLKLFAPGDMELLGSVTNLHTLRVNEGQDGGLLFPLQAFSAHSRILKLLAAPTYIYMVCWSNNGKAWADKVLLLRWVVTEGFWASALTSLTQVWLEATCDNAVREVKQKLENHPKKPNLKPGASAERKSLNRSRVCRKGSHGFLTLFFLFFQSSQPDRASSMYYLRLFLVDVRAG
jgi:hypothetical protein